MYRAGSTEQCSFVQTNLAMKLYIMRRLNCLDKSFLPHHDKIITIRASMPTIKTPIVVTDNAIHLYSKKTSPKVYSRIKSANS
jgi:arsenate reductase-like glutaredoxin family protein